MAYGDFKDLTSRTTSNKILHDKAFNIAKNLKSDGDQRILPQRFMNFLIKKTSRSCIKYENMSDQQLEEELLAIINKPIIRKFKKRKVHSTFIENIWDVDLADMQLISKFNKRFRVLLFVNNIFSKYAWVIPLKDKKEIIITNAFQKNFR